MATARTRLIDIGFEEMRNVPVTGLFVATYAETDMGKTTFGLTAPGPVAVFDGDKGLKGVVNNFADIKQIVRFKLELPETPASETEMIMGEGKDKGEVIRTKNTPKISKDVLEQAQETWSKFKNAIDYCLEDNSIRTLFIDTGTVLWQLFRVSKFGKIQQIPASAYTVINPEYKQFLNKLKTATEEQRKNVIISHQMRDVFVNDKKVGRREPAWFSETEFIADIVLQLKCDKETREYSMFLTKCKPNQAMRWETYPGDLCTFPMLASMATGQDIEAWT